MAAGLPFLGAGALLVASALGSEERGAERLVPIGIGLVFGEAGVLLGALGVWLLGRHRRAERLRAEFPDRPWWQEGLWADFRIASGSPLGLAALWAVAILVASMVSVFAAGAFGGGEVETALKAVAGLFGFVSFALLATAAYLTLRAVKYGWPALHLAAVPVLPGTRLEGAIVVPASVYSPEGVKLTLKCVETVEVKRREEGRTVRDHESRDIHESSAEVPPEDLRPVVDGGTVIPVAIDVPAGLPARKTEGATSYVWLLEARGATAGVNFGASFEVPIFEADAALVERRPDPLPG